MKGAVRRARERHLALTKPPGSLGRLEEIGAQARGDGRRSYATGNREPRGGDLCGRSWRPSPGCLALAAGGHRGDGQELLCRGRRGKHPRPERRGEGQRPRRRSGLRVGTASAAARGEEAGWHGRPEPRGGDEPGGRRAGR
jgi:hypothetical protein